LKKFPQIINNLTYFNNYSIMRNTTDKQHLSIICISFATVFLLSFGVTDFDAFAQVIQPEYDESIPSALVNYNSDTNESTITWDFSGLDDYTDGTLVGQPAKCVVKGDYDYNNNPVTDPDLEITSFQPKEYLPTYLPANVPGNLVSISYSAVEGEEIPCTGQLTINFDTVMAHANNTGSYVGVEPFISFYIMTSNGQFDSDDSYVVDEVLIMYHPTASEIDQATVDWACGANDTDVTNQIAMGNVLFIDQTGIRGTGGPNNCDTVLELESLEFCCTFPVQSSNDDCDADCVAPSFGVDGNNNLIVSGGFTYNTQSAHVTDFHTEFPLITVITNSINTATVKVYENYGPSNIEFVQFGLGMERAGSALDDAESLVEISFEDDKIKGVEIEDDNNLVDIISISYSEVACSPGSSFDCLEVEMRYIYREQPRYNVMAINAIDIAGNTQTNYLNDGVLVTGESLNEPLLQTVAAGRDDPLYPQKAGNILLTLIDFKTDLWQDEYGYMWSNNGYRPALVNDVPLPILEPDNYSKWSGYNDRWNSEFEKYKQDQVDKAILTISEVYYLRN